MPNNAPDWNGFEFELRYDADAVMRECLQIEAHRLSLQQQYLPRDWECDLQHLFIVRVVHGTTAIEGNPLREQEVADQLEASADAPPGDRIHAQTQNAARAFDWVRRNFAEPRPLRRDDIVTIHQLLTTGSDEHDNAPGRTRQSGHNVTAGSPALGGVHRAPPGGECVSGLLDRFLEFVNSKRFTQQNKVIQALAAHFYFVTLHPFGDGNGRTTRCLEAAILHGGGYNTYGFYSLSNYFYRNRDDYFRILQETRTRHRYDLTHFLLFGLKGFGEELDRINAYVRNRTHRLHYRELIRRCAGKRVGARRRLLNVREAKLLNQILDISKPPDPFSDEPTKVATWTELMKFCSHLYQDRTQRTMIRELSRLQDLGFITFTRDRGTEEWRVLLNFEAIRRY